MPDGDGPPTLGKFLTTIPPEFPLSLETPHGFAKVVIEKGIDADDIWERAEAAPLPPEDIATLKVVLALRDLTRSHPPMMEELHKRREDNLDGAMAFLTKLTPVEWLELAYTVGQPAGSTLSVGEYADQLESEVEATHPTRVFGARLRQGVLHLEDFPAVEVAQFLQEYQDFDFSSSQVEPFLHEHGLENDALKSALLKTQRVQVLSANWRETGALLNRGLDSASRIIQYGKEQFQQLMADEIAPARTAVLYGNAQETMVVTLALATQYARRFNALNLAVLPAPKTTDTVLQKYSQPSHAVRRSRLLRMPALPLSTQSCGVPG